MKRLVIGCTCCALGVILCAVNWLGAAVNVAQVTEWDTTKGRLSAAYSIVGHGPLVFGVILLVVGAVLLAHYFFSLASAWANAHDAVQPETSTDGVAQ